MAGHEAAQRKADRVGRHVVPLIDEARPAADGMARREEQLVRLHRREHALTRHSKPLELQLELLRVDETGLVIAEELTQDLLKGQ